MIEQIINRRSIRKYSSKPVEDEKIIKLLESARIAPSGSNTQPWHFIVIKSEPLREKIAEAAHNQRWMISAPVFIACVADIRSRIKEDMYIEIDENSSQVEIKQIIRDTAIAIEHIVLTAGYMGLGTCWVSDFAQKDIRPIIGVNTDKYVVSILTVGYADEDPKSRPRKALEEIVHYESW
ncbi:MAG TPA: nitroreductase family protein [Clostridia bacterium]|nr:nitroreductase family protein [Clostridia bacterium]